MNARPWPSLEIDDWLPTYDTLHRWTQIVGKTRLALSPFENHWWHGALYVTVNGWSTSPMPIDGGNLEIEFDFTSHRLVGRTSEGREKSIRLENKSVADFWGEYHEMLGALGVHVHIDGRPNEIADATPFREDRGHATYDGGAARRCWRILTGVDRVLKEFRGGFTGKCSPSHLWWGGFDIACTRFSGRRAPLYSGAVPNTPDYVMQEAYSHECISAGWWPGTAGAPVAEPAFYAYAYPEPAGCSSAPIDPPGAYYHTELREWVLPYNAVRRSSDPDLMVMRFLESTYETAAALGGWDVAAFRSARPGRVSPLAI